jgi:SusD family.
MLARKWVNYRAIPYNGQIDFYSWPIIRLADLYLLYSEALNESPEGNGEPAADVYKYINLVRERSGLESVQDSWSKYSLYPEKYKTKAGMRDIIRQERRIELAFEGQAWFDLRRWKMMEQLFGASTMRGYNLKISDNVEYISTPTVIHTTNYQSRNNLWPIKDSELNKNLNLVQNSGWE